jgi:glucan phosphoethanolaminetransferase (alkaline phosphatase superfamily)
MADATPAPPTSSATARRRRTRTRRRLVGAALLVAPALAILAADLVRRADRLLALDRQYRVAYAGTLAASLVFWGILVAAASRRRGRVRHVAAGLFAVLFALTFGVQAAFYRFYNIYLSVDSQLAFRSFLDAPHGALDLRWLWFWVYFGGSTVLALAILVGARRFGRPGRWSRRITPFLVPPALVGMALVPSSYRRIQASTFDVIYFDGLQELAKLLTAPPSKKHQPGPFLQPRRVPTIPPIASRPPRPRNVLVILEESIRHDAVCVAYDPKCTAPGRHTNDAVPERMPLLQMRALATSTNVSQGVLYSGVSPVASEETWLRAPYVFSFAHAAGYTTAYWTGQNVITWGTRFFTQDEPLTSRAYATTIDSTANTDLGVSDRDTTRWAIEHLGELREPFFGVVHYSSAHRPYHTERALSPYRDGDGSRMSARYRNAVNLSDLAVAELLRAVRAAPFGERTVVVYTSDHGECFFENGYTGHGLGLGEAELRVPAWIDAPKGTLTDDEAESLRGARESLAWHPDLAATLLDLLGVWDAPEVAPYRGAMIGRPLTRPERTTDAVPLTTCNWGFRFHEHGSWGMMRGTKKIWARHDDKQPGFRCYDLASDPEEKALLPEADCGDLGDLARGIFGGTPREAPGYPTMRR